MSHHSPGMPVSASAINAGFGAVPGTNHVTKEQLAAAARAQQYHVGKMAAYRLRLAEDELPTAEQVTPEVAEAQGADLGGAA